MSKMPMKIANAIEKTSTTLVWFINSSRVGQFTLENSTCTSLAKVVSFCHICLHIELWRWLSPLPHSDRR